MMHTGRAHTIAPIDDLADLVEKLIHHTWTLCTGFRWRDLVLLNDATSENGAQEYAVFRDGRQVESLTVSWMTSLGLRVELESLSSGRDDGATGAPMQPRAVHPQGACHLCA